MRRFVLSACALLAVSAAANAKPGIAASTVNLRAEANTTSMVLTKMPAGALLDVGDCNEGWCAVTFRGKSGFAIATAIDTTGRARPVLRRRPPPGYYPPPAYVVAPPPPVYYYGYGYGPYWGRPYYWGGGPRWGGYGYGYRSGFRRW